MAELLKFNPISDKRTVILLLFLIVFSAALRLVAVTSVPPGLYQDESAIGYNAYSILKTGKDEYGISYPLYFKSFGDYKLPVYIYLTAISIKLFGLTEFAVRFPSILSGIIAVAVLFLFLKYLTKNTTLAFIGGLVLALNPAHFFFSRAGFEVNIALTFALAGCYFFVLGATKNKFLHIIISIILFGLSLYSYNVTRLIAPLFVLGLVILYWKQIKSFRLAYKVSALVVFLIILIPFLRDFLSASGVNSATSTLITSSDVLAKDLEFRSYLSSLPHIYTTLFYNQYIYMLFQYLQNLALLISGSFFYVNGTTEPNQGIGNVGFFYLFDLPFFVYGLFIYFRAKIKSFQIFALWLLISVFVLALSKDVPQATRGYFLVLPVVCFTALGLFSFFYYLSTMHNKFLKYFYVAIFAAIAFYNIQFFLLSYFYRFPLVYADEWRSEDKVLSLYLSAHQNQYNKIIIDQDTGFVYTTYLFYSAYPPSEFVATAKRYRDGVLLKANAWGKFQIRDISWRKDLATPHTLIVALPPDVPAHVKILTEFYEPVTYSVFSVNEKVVSSAMHVGEYDIISTDQNKNLEL